MKFVSFFAGIGGIDLGLERAGHECVGQVEIDPYCQRVLAKHWPNVWRHDDILTLKPEDIPAADLWCGGFPCQDVSVAAAHWTVSQGLDGERSGLFWSLARLVRIRRPGKLLLENVAALLMGGLGEVLCELAATRCHAEWGCVRACECGAFHERDRVFVLSDRDGDRVEGYFTQEIPRFEEFSWLQGSRSLQEVRERSDIHSPIFCGGTHGVPSRVDRIRALGNAVVPQVAEYIGRCLKQAEDTAPDTTNAAQEAEPDRAGELT